MDGLQVISYIGTVAKSPPFDGDTDVKIPAHFTEIIWIVTYSCIIILR